MFTQFNHPGCHVIHTVYRRVLGLTQTHQSFKPLVWCERLTLFKIIMSHSYTASQCLFTHELRSLQWCKTHLASYQSRVLQVSAHLPGLGLMACKTWVCSVDQLSVPWHSVLSLYLCYSGMALGRMIPLWGSQTGCTDVSQSVAAVGTGTSPLTQGSLSQGGVTAGRASLLPHCARFCVYCAFVCFLNAY